MTADKINVLFLVHHPVQDASSRYRVYQFLPILRQQGFHCDIRPFTTPRLFQAIRQNEGWPIKLVQTLFCTARRLRDLWSVKRYDIVFIHREVYPFLMPWMERVVLNRHTKVVFGLDDALYIGHDRSATKYSWMYDFKYGSGLNEVLQRSKLVVAGSSIIAEYVRQFNASVTVIPTVIDTASYPFTLPKEPSDGVITVGWYGSNSTSPYLLHIVPALQRLAEAHPGRLRFRFFGDRELSLPLPNFEALPFRLESEMTDLQSIDIGLMPLIDTPWTRAKCAFKAIQYMGLGIPAVVSPIGMSTELVQNERNGLYAGTPDEWFAQMDRLVRDVDLRRRLALAARKTIEERYSLEVWGNSFTDQLRHIHRDESIDLFRPQEAVGEIELELHRAGK